MNNQDLKFIVSRTRKERIQKINEQSEPTLKLLGRCKENSLFLSKNSKNTATKQKFVAAYLTEINPPQKTGYGIMTQQMSKA